MVQIPTSQTEQTARSSGREDQERRLAQAVEQAAEAVMLTSVNGTIEYVNPAFTRLTGYRAEEALGQTPRILSSGAHGNEFYSEMWRTLLGGDVFEATFTNRRKSGELYYLEQTITPILGEDGVPSSFISTGRDITERRGIEERLGNQEKMATIGHLAAGVAHEVGNPLTAISMVVESLQRRLDEPWVIGKLDVVAQHVDRINATVRRLVDFARPLPDERRETSLNQVVRDAVDILRFDRRAKHLEIDLDLAPDLPDVSVAVDQWIQIFLNLGFNSLDAFEAQGEPRAARIAVRTFLKPNGRGQTLYVEWSDNGQGIAEADAARIFEPFFTTKSTGSSGLGLTLSQRIVSDHGGSIRLERRAGPLGGIEGRQHSPGQHSPGSLFVITLERGR